MDGAPRPDDAWERAPVGLLTLSADGVVLRANATVAEWTGRAEADLIGAVRLTDLLAVGSRLYWETHLSPLLAVQHRLDEAAVELRSADGARPVLLSALAVGDVRHVALSSAARRAAGTSASCCRRPAGPNAARPGSPCCSRSPPRCPAPPTWWPSSTRCWPPRPRSG